MTGVPSKPSVTSTFSRWRGTPPRSCCSCSAYYATRKTPKVKQWLIRHPQFHLHLTPTSNSWLNLVQRWFAELTTRKLRGSAHRSVTELERDVRRWTNQWNTNPKPFTWTKTADEILETLAAYCQRINDSGHQRDVG